MRCVVYSKFVVMMRKSFDIKKDVVTDKETSVTVVEKSHIEVGNTIFFRNNANENDCTNTSLCYDSLCI